MKMVQRLKEPEALSPGYWKSGQRTHRIERLRGEHLEGAGIEEDVDSTRGKYSEVTEERQFWEAGELDEGYQSNNDREVEQKRSLSQKKHTESLLFVKAALAHSPLMQVQG
jgi:hypothetical protein